MWKWSLKSKPSPLMEALNLLKEQCTEQNHTLSEQIGKLTRLQYKSGLELQGRMERLQESTDSIMKYQDVITNLQNKLTEKQNVMTTLSDSLINWLDDMDLMLSRIQGEEQQAWSQLLNQWSEQLLSSLSLMGIRELNVLGSSFDPRWSESIGTIAQSVFVAQSNYTIVESLSLGQAGKPYQIVEIIRRGFLAENGTLLRKAQVITVANLPEPSSEPGVI